MELPSLPTPLRADPTLSRLDDDRAQAVLQLAARLGQAAKWPGTAFHAVLARWLETGLTMEADLRDWLREQVPVIAVAFGVALPATNAGDGARFDQALRHADEWRRQGWSVYHWKTGECPPPGDSINACPQVLFGRGEVLSDRCSVALFNSRKPRRFHCQEPWLAALRDVLAAVAALPIRLVSSRGTISYDLVSCFAEIRGVPLGLVATDEVSSEGDWAKPAIVAVTTGDPQPAAGRGWSEDSIVLTCALHPVVCPKPRRMVCRDRLLAHLADLHVVLAVRDQGNLLGILRAQQQYQPRWQWILEHSEESESMRGNRVLVKEFPEWYHPLMVPSATGSARLFPINPHALAGTTKDESPPLERGLESGFTPLWQRGAGGILI